MKRYFRRINHDPGSRYFLEHLNQSIISKMDVTQVRSPRRRERKRNIARHFKKRTSGQWLEQPANVIVFRVMNAEASIGNVETWNAFSGHLFAHCDPEPTTLNRFAAGAKVSVRVGDARGPHFTDCDCVRL